MSSTSSKNTFGQAFQHAKAPIIISFLVTPTRFLLEYLGCPEYAIFLIGLLWLTLAFSVYWAVKQYAQPSAYLSVLLSLIIFSPISRLTVVAAWWVDKTWNIGTHYSLYFENWPQVILNQVIYGSLVQIIPGFILAAITIRVLRYKKPN